MTRDRLETGLRRWGPGAIVAGLALLVVLLGLRAARHPEEGDTRFYVRAAGLFLAGEDLYWAAPEPSGYRPTTGYTYPPPFAAACAWTLPVPYPALRVLWLALMSAALVLAVRVALRGLPDCRRPGLTLLLVAPLLLRFGINDLAHGQTNALLTLLLALALTARRPAAAGAALGVALAIKPTAWPLLGWWLIAGRARAALVAAACAAGLVLLVPLPRYGLAGTARLLASWLELMGAFTRDVADAGGNAALSATLMRLSPPAWSQDPWPFRALSLGLGALACAGLAWRRRAHPGAPAAVLALGALLSPVTWKAHLVVLVLPGLHAARRLADDPAARPRDALPWALAVALLTVTSRGLLGRLPGLDRGEELGALTAGVALVGALAVARRPDTLVARDTADATRGTNASAADEA